MDSSPERLPGNSNRPLREEGPCLQDGKFTQETRKDAQHPSLHECGQDPLPSSRVLGSLPHILELGLFPLPPFSCLTRDV